MIFLYHLYSTNKLFIYYMSLRNRDVLIEYIRVVRDHQVLLEKIAKYIDTANSRVTTTVTAFLQSNNMGENQSSINTTSSRDTNNIISRNTDLPGYMQPTTSSYSRSRLSIPPPPVAITPAISPAISPAIPPPPPPPPISITNATQRLASINENATDVPETNDNITELSTDTTTEIRGANLTRFRSWLNPQPTITSNIDVPRISPPPGLSVLRSHRRGLNIRYRTPVRRTRAPYALDIPDDEEEVSRDIGSPVRVRPSIIQIRNSTELLKWEDMDDNYQETCPISMHTFVEGDDVIRIKSCKHIFREMNLRQWFRYSPKCPICRYDVRDWVQPNI